MIRRSFLSTAHNGLEKLPDPLAQRTNLVLDINVPIHIVYNKLGQVQIVDGPAPYGILTEKRITKRILQHHKPKKEKVNPIKTALTYKRIYQSLDCPNIKETAEIIGVSKGRVHQMLNLLKFDERILDYLLEDKTGENYTERQLRGLLQLPLDEQFKKLEKYHMSKQNEFSSSCIKHLRPFPKART
ncbi:hypothetical protein ACFL49_00965 [Candidatus Omnitrophota bacterium]